MKNQNVQSHHAVSYARSVGLSLRAWLDLAVQRATRKTIFIAVCTVAIAYGSYALFLKGSGEAVQARGRKPTTVFLEGSTSIGQTFRVNADGLDSVELRVGPMDAPLTTDFRCELLEAVGGTSGPARRWVEHVELPSSGGVHRFTFPTVTRSSGVTFRFAIRLDRPGLRVPIEASVDNVFDGGAMIVNDREEWGDLVFTAGTMASTAFGRFRLVATRLPWPLRAPSVQIGLLATFTWAWLALIYWLFVARPDVT